MSRNSLKQHVGKRLKAIRLSQDRTQEQMAELGKVDFRYYQRIEAGEANLTLDTIEKLARLYKVKPIELFI